MSAVHRNTVPPPFGGSRVLRPHSFALDCRSLSAALSLAQNLDPAPRRATRRRPVDHKADAEAGAERAAQEAAQT